MAKLEMRVGQRSGIRFSAKFRQAGLLIEAYPNLEFLKGQTVILRRDNDTWYEIHPADNPSLTKLTEYYPVPIRDVTDVILVSSISDEDEEE